MINQAGIDLIKYFERLELKAYQCTAGVWSVGFGHTSDDFFKVDKNTTVTEEFALKLFLHDIAEAEDTVKRQFLGWQALNENQYAAIVSFVYNTGSLKYYDKKAKRFKDRTLLLKLKKPNFAGVAEAFMLYTKDKLGNELLGLKRRRIKEAELFNKPA